MKRRVGPIILPIVLTPESRYQNNGYPRTHFWIQTIINLMRALITQLFHFITWSNAGITTW